MTILDNGVNGVNGHRVRQHVTEELEIGIGLVIHRHQNMEPSFVRYMRSFMKLLSNSIIREFVCIQKRKSIIQ